MFGYPRFKSNQNFLANVNTFFFKHQMHNFKLIILLSVVHFHHHLCRCPSFVLLCLLSTFPLHSFFLPLLFLPSHNCHTNGIFDICPLNHLPHNRQHSTLFKLPALEPGFNTSPSWCDVTQALQAFCASVS